MREHLTVVTRKGQITVPAEIRRALGLQEGDKIAVSLVEGSHGEASLRPVRSVAEMTFGIFAGREGPKDLHELREAFIDEVAEREMARRPAAVTGAHGRKEV